MLERFLTPRSSTISYAAITKLHQTLRMKPKSATEDVLDSKSRRSRDLLHSHEAPRQLAYKKLQSQRYKLHLLVCFPFAFLQATLSVWWLIMHAVWYLHCTADVGFLNSGCSSWRFFCCQLRMRNHDFIFN